MSMKKILPCLFLVISMMWFLFQNASLGMPVTYLSSAWTILSSTEIKWQTLFYSFLGGYLAGTIPFGILIARVLSLGNLRNVGSGNIGATNVLRTGNKMAAAMTLVMDAGKGALAILVAHTIFHGNPNHEIMVYASALGAVIGHIFPIWLKFRGGKGVATAAGAILALSWPIGWIVIGSWLVTVLLTGISSLGAITVIIIGPIVAWLLGNGMMLLWFAVVSTLLLLTHRDNIVRLLQGKESRFVSQRHKKKIA